MVSTRMYKELIGVEMLYSSLSYGGATYTKYLIDSNAGFSTNFAMSETLAEVSPPLTTAGLMQNATFLYRTPFEKPTRIEGPVWGNFCFTVQNNVTSSYKTAITEANVSLYAIQSDGTSRTLINEYEIYPAATGVGEIGVAGYGSLRTETGGIFYSTSIDCVVQPTELLALNVKVYGYKTSSSSTHKYWTRVDMSDADLKIALPLVGV